MESDLFHFDLLPEDIMKEILFFLDSRSLVCAKCTCAKFLRLARDVFGERKIRGDLDIVREVSLRNIEYITILNGLLAAVVGTEIKILRPNGEIARVITVSRNVLTLTEWGSGLATGWYGNIHLYSREDGTSTGMLVDNHVLTLCIWGKLLVSGSGDHTVKLWSKSAGEPRIFTGHTAAVRSLAVFGDLLASGSDDDTVKLWDAAGTCVRTLHGHEGYVRHLVVFAGFLVSGSDDRTLRWWDTSGACVKILPKHPERICGLASSDMLLVSSCLNATKLWNKEGEWLRTISRECDLRGVRLLLFLSDQLVECLPDRLLFWA